MKSRLNLIGVLVMLIVFISVLGVSSAMADVHTPWFDPAWAYRREVSVSNPSGVEQSNLQVQISLGSDFDFTLAKSDGADIRITAEDGTTLLPFWIETWDDAVEVASIWVKLSSLSADGAMIILYYGNDSASSVSDGYAVFEAYDGFETNAVGSTPVVPTTGSWNKYPGNPVLDCTNCGFSSVFYDSTTSTYHMFSSWGSIKHFTSPDGIDWSADPTNPVLTASQAWEGSNVGVPMAWQEGDTWYMLYRGGNPDQIGLATSTDKVNWVKYAGNPVISGDPGAWDDVSLDPWGVMKVGDTYYLWYNTIGAMPTGGGRGTGLATSTDLMTWTKDPNNPIFTGGRFCGFPFHYDGYYYMLIPHYTSGSDFSQHELYRDANPTFYPADREYLGVAIDYGPTTWDDHDQDTPAVLTDDIYRNSFSVTGGELWVYYAGEGGADQGDWWTGLVIEEDIDAAIAGLQASQLSWTVSGDVSVVDTPTHQGVRAVQQNAPGGGVTITGSFGQSPTGVVSAWMRRDNSTSGDYDIYLYGEALSAVAGLGRDGDFHYWNGSFQPTGVDWAVDTWYLVSLEFDTLTDSYNFAVYDEVMTEIVRVDDIGFGNAASYIDRAMMYTSSGFSGQAFYDDFYVRKWSEASPGVVLLAIEEEQQTKVVNGTVPVLFDKFGITIDVQAQGTLSDITIVHTSEDHTNATTGIQSGYWNILANGGTGFNVDLIFPHDNLPDPKICRFTGGPGAGWDCYRDSFTSTTVTRTGVTAFSDWAVGDGVGPTLARLISFSVNSRVNIWPVLVTLLIAGLGAGGTVFLKRRREV